MDRTVKAIRGEMASLLEKAKKAEAELSGRACRCFGKRRKRLEDMAYQMGELAYELDRRIDEIDWQDME